MSAQEALAELAALCGIEPAFYDLQGTCHVTSPQTQKALLAANGIDVSDDAAIHAALAALHHARADRWFPHEIIVTSGQEAAQNFGLGAQWHIRDVDSDAIVAEGAPRDFITVPPLASGVYVLSATASGRTEEVTVLAAPARLPSVAEQTGAQRLWGMNLALYGVRSARNTGLGDFEDLARVAERAGAKGASFVGVNPLHNMGFSDGTAISPYSPSHRGYLNTSYIALDRISGGTAPEESQALRAAEQVKYSAQKRAHHAGLEAAFAAFGRAADAQARADLAAFTAAGGEDLARFAHFEALGEVHGTDWHGWPVAPAAPAPERVDFHIWLQWVADAQLGDAQARARASGMPLGLYLDLAVGARRDGAEAWCDSAAIAQGAAIGAPPDQLNPEGQNWNLAAFAPRKLAALHYRPLRQILAQTMRHAGIIRIDHVLGLNRSFWIPDDGSAGAYVRQPFESLLAIIKIEAERHGCLVVGEDLGLVPDGFRETMRGHGFYGYSVMQYETDGDGAFRDPAQTEAQVLSCFATHDTPTVAGFAAGRDIDWWEALGWIDADQAAQQRGLRAQQVARVGGPDFAAATLDLLARARAGLVVVQLDDILGALEAQNLPGTIDAHPNWRRKYDVTLEQLDSAPQFGAVAQLMQTHDRAHKNKGPDDAK